MSRTITYNHHIALIFTGLLFVLTFSSVPAHAETDSAASTTKERGNGTLLIEKKVEKLLHELKVLDGRKEKITRQLALLKTRREKIASSTPERANKGLLRSYAELDLQRVRIEKRIAAIKEVLTQLEQAKEIRTKGELRAKIKLHLQKYRETRSKIKSEKDSNTSSGEVLGASDSYAMTLERFVDELIMFEDDLVAAGYAGTKALWGPGIDNPNSDEDFTTSILKFAPCKSPILRMLCGGKPGPGYESSLDDLENPTNDSGGVVPSHVSPAVGQPIAAQPPGQICRMLRRGTVDSEPIGEVSALQKLLAEDPAIYPSGAITGYFGELTEEALKRYQTKYGIVATGTPESTGFGIVGPHTRARLGIGCGHLLDIANGSAILAEFGEDDEVSGDAPLAVRFIYTPDAEDESSMYRVDFGDGTTVRMERNVWSQDAHARMLSTRHLYLKPETYIAKLIRQKPWSCPENIACAAVMPASETIGEIEVTVTKREDDDSDDCLRGRIEGCKDTHSAYVHFPRAATETIRGTEPLTVTFTVSGPKPYDGIFTIDFGDGEEGETNEGGCPSNAYIAMPCTLPSVTHTYEDEGTYEAELLNPTMRIADTALKVDIVVVSSEND